MTTTKSNQEGTLQLRASKACSCQVNFLPLPVQAQVSSFESVKEKWQEGQLSVCVSPGWKRQNSNISTTHNIHQRPIEHSTSATMANIQGFPTMDFKHWVNWARYQERFGVRINCTEWYEPGQRSHSEEAQYFRSLGWESFYVDLGLEINHVVAATPIGIEVSFGPDPDYPAEAGISGAELRRKVEASVETVTEFRVDADPWVYTPKEVHSPDNMETLPRHEQITTVRILGKTWDEWMHARWPIPQVVQTESGGEGNQGGDQQTENQGDDQQNGNHNGGEVTWDYGSEYEYSDEESSDDQMGDDDTDDQNGNHDGDEQNGNNDGDDVGTKDMGAMTIEE
ncbi:hypothetical protein V8F20_005962 [Naviculisporaceae sp. PSN 640]